MNSIDNRKEKIFSFDVQGKKLIFEVNSFASRAEKSIICRYGNTTVLTTLCIKDLEEEPDFVHLNVLVNEKFYSVGRIPSGFNKRETRPSYDSILIARLIDRSLRSCFSLSEKKDIQITNTILSVDEECDLRLASCWSSFFVCLISEKLSFNFPISTVIVADLEGVFICNPTLEELNKSNFEIIVTASKEKVLMLEMFSREISEEKIKSIISFAFDQIILMIDEIFHPLLNEKLIIEKIKHSNQNNSDNEKNKMDMNLEFNVFSKRIEDFLSKTFLDLKVDWNIKKDSLENFPLVLLNEFKTFSLSEIEKFWNHHLKAKIYYEISEKGFRVDGRRIDDIRNLKVKIDYLPKVHGSSLFSRGNTTVISIITFGKSSEKQQIDNAFSKNSFFKHFIHHYNFPAFAVNLISSSKNISRREIGHGKLVEKTFHYLIPPLDEFPYATRIVSEVISSEGSSSQASICASSLAMMSSGFPLKNHVAGIAIGLFRNVIVTDINDLEDKFGEIDFKISGTKNGICSFQMDVKNDGISLNTIFECFKKAKKARLLIIQEMDSVIFEPKKNLSDKMLKCRKVYFESSKIGLIIGKGGKNINLITSKTGAKVDFRNDGYVVIYHAENKNIDDAYEMMKKIISIQTKL